MTLGRLGQKLLLVAGTMAFQIVALGLLFVILQRGFYGHGMLTPAAYAGPVVVAGVVRESGLVVLLLATFVPLALCWRSVSWRAVDARRHTRVFVVIVAAVFAWTFSTYDVNLFFDQAHVVDRLLLVALCGALWFHPMALPPFLVVLFALVTQAQMPLPEGPWIWPDKRLPLDALVLCLGYVLLVAALRKRTQPMLLPFLLLCLTGMTYGHAAINKAALGPAPWTWVLEDDLGNLFVSAHLNGGWLRGLGLDGAASVSRAIHAVHIPLAIGTLMIELSGLALVVKWRITRIALPAFVLLHVGILASSGIFFWKWIVFDLSLLWFVSRCLRARAAASDDERPAAPLFSWKMTGASLVIMIACARWVDPVSFAWFDTRMANYFEIYGRAESGHRYRIDPRFFAPYDILLQQSRHYYAVRGPVVVNTYGTTHDVALADALDHARVDDIPEIRARFGQRLTSLEMSRPFFELVRRYVVAAQRRGGRRSVVSWLAPPFHFQTTAAADEFDFQERLTSVEIQFVEYFFDGDTITETRRQPVVTFPVE